MIRVFALLATLPFAAHADPQPAVLELMPYMEDTAACFDSAEDPAAATACIGAGSAICMDADPSQNQTTLGMMFCALAEKEAWDRLLNLQYRETMDRFRAIDAQEAEIFPEFANRADSLRDAQRAWIALRDADCSLKYAMWGSGSMRQIAGANCQLQLTAKRTIYLRFLGEGLR